MNLYGFFNQFDIFLSSDEKSMPKRYILYFSIRFLLNARTIFVFSCLESHLEDVYHFNGILIFSV